ncbi:C-type mannose receptor 2-like [Penaeus indicus]|uniref:C-type mannose receptor 2-like n=1 Tax=Penaeus indicus TaxID=29960 RepID=UPI00300D6E8D
MGLAAAVLWLSAAAAARALVVPPLRLDGNESHTDVILMRQEVILEEMVMLLTEIRDTLVDRRRVTDEAPRDRVTDEPLRPSVTDAPRSTTTTAKTSNAPPTCPDKFQEVDGVCLHLASSKQMSWDEARVYCQRLGGDLVHGLRNAEAGQSLVRDKYLAGESVVWVGGHDRSSEGRWEWLSGDAIPMDSTLWGIFLIMKQPSGGKSENCGCFYGPDEYQLHDIPCNRQYEPLCQVDHRNG